MIKNGIIQDKYIDGVPLIVDLIPMSNRTSRPGYEMKAEHITIHNTGNSNPRANAKMHTNYVDTAKGYVSWHFTVDDKEIYQELPVNETAWHAGDGNGKGNMASVGIEICETGDYAKAEENAIKLIAYLIRELNLRISVVVPHQHWSGKYCPRLILGGKGWNEFSKRIGDYMVKKSWQQELGEKALDKLEAKDLVENVKDWKKKDLKNENVPLWLFFEMLNRIDDNK